MPAFAQEQTYRHVNAEAHTDVEEHTHVHAHTPPQSIHGLHTIPVSLLLGGLKQHIKVDLGQGNFYSSDKQTKKKNIALHYLLLFHKGNSGVSHAEGDKV